MILSLHLPINANHGFAQAASTSFSVIDWVKPSIELSLQAPVACGLPTVALSWVVYTNQYD